MNIHTKMLRLLSFAAAVLVLGQLPRGWAAEASVIPTTACSPSLEVCVGDLSFRITSLRVSQRNNLGNSVAAAALSIHNRGTKPVSLTYVDDSAAMTDDHGYTWKDAVDVNRNTSGIALTAYNGASLESVIDPGSAIGITLPMAFAMNDGQTPGASFDMQATFVSYEDLGQGRLRRLRTYPVSFVGLQPNKAPGVPVPGAEPVGDAVKKALGSIFGQ